MLFLYPAAELLVLFGLFIKSTTVWISEPLLYPYLCVFPEMLGNVSAGFDYRDSARVWKTPDGDHEGPYYERRPWSNKSLTPLPAKLPLGPVAPSLFVLLPRQRSASWVLQSDIRLRTGGE